MYKKLCSLRRLARALSFLLSSDDWTRKLLRRIHTRRRAAKERRGDDDIATAEEIRPDGFHGRTRRSRNARVTNVFAVRDDSTRRGLFLFFFIYLFSRFADTASLTRRDDEIGSVVVYGHWGTDGLRPRDFLHAKNGSFDLFILIYL